MKRSSRSGAILPKAREGVQVWISNLHRHLFADLLKDLLEDQRLKTEISL